MEQNIQVIEKPDWVSWDDIHDVLWEAHIPNREKGIIMRNPSLPGEEIKNKIGSNGLFYLAIDGKKVVGTLAIIIKTGKQWYSKGDYGYFCFGAVLPEYNGMGIYQKLYQQTESAAKERGLRAIIGDTNEKNTRILKITKQDGYVLVGYKACKDHYNNVIAKWLDGCPYPSWYIKLRYFLSKTMIKIRFRIDTKKGKVKRFGF